MITVDFETRSRVDLLKHGAYNYAQDASTDILCASFHAEVDGKDLWWVWMPSEPLDPKLIELLNEAKYIAAHNAAFDRLIWNFIAEPDYNFPKIPFDKWYCTSAQMRVNNLPASLEHAARALDSRHKKDTTGNMLIKKLSVPQKDGEFCNDEDLLEQMAAYCLQDVRTTVGIVRATRMMNDQEHEDWLNNEDINERGVKIDTALAEVAMGYTNDEYLQLAKELSAITGGIITKHTQYARAAKWVIDELGPDHDAYQYAFKINGKGEEVASLDVNIREELLSRHENEEFTLPESVIDFIIVMNSTKSSVTKFKNMRLRADVEDDRVRGAFVYAGASQTLRFASRGLQLHNMPSRGGFSAEEAVEAYEGIMRGEKPEDVMNTLKFLLRHALMPEEGNVFVVGDWSGIEARILPWLSKSEGGQVKLDKIATGIDIYEETGEEIGFDRTVGKVFELACGYQGGVAAFKQFAKMYGVSLPESKIKPAITKWRKLNSWVVEFWHDLEKAAIKAMRTPETPIEAGRVSYIYLPALIGGSLLCLLPDGTYITYPQARLERAKGKSILTALKASTKMKAGDTEWPRQQLYGGMLAGHCTQGNAGGLLRDLITRIEHTVAHVHDEVILEVPVEKAVEVRDALEVEMRTPPVWAEGLPLKAVPVVMQRYGK